LSAVEGGIVTFGPNSVLTPVFTGSSSNFLNQVLAQQLGFGAPVFVSQSSLIPSFNAATGTFSFTPFHNIRVNTLVCVGCTGP
jgi:hypothetical protein